MGEKHKIKIEFCGTNSSDVTGSCIWIKTPTKQILLECGLYQSAGTTLSAYKINNAHWKFKPSQIDYVFVNHCHADHIGLAPRLYKNGCSAKMIMPEGSKAIAEILMRDSANIMSAEADEISKQYSRDYSPIYEQNDVDVCVRHLCEYPFGEIIELDESIKFRFVSSGHILNSAQLELWITSGDMTKKILYTSDLGNTHLIKYYTAPFVPVKKADIVIGEATYVGENRIANKKVREKDLEKLKNVLEETCISSRCKVLIPVFANSRCQEMLTYLYDIFGQNKNFRIPVLIDSPMACRVCQAYSDVLSGDDLDKWNKVLTWENIHFISDPDESRAWQNDQSPAVILSSSGMLTNGRSRAYCKSLLPNPNNTIVFCGFSVENSLASIIKAGNVKTIKLSGSRVANRCRIVDLHSFSSHMQQDSLLKYYSNIDCEKIILVHGEMNEKLKFAQMLEEAISKKDRTSKVVCSNKGYSLTI